MLHSSGKAYVIRLIANGFLNKEIAAHLSIATDTAQLHLKNIYRKLHVNNRVQVVQRVMERNKRI